MNSPQATAKKPKDVSISKTCKTCKDTNCSRREKSETLLYCTDWTDIKPNPEDAEDGYDD